MQHSGCAQMIACESRVSGCAPACYKAWLPLFLQGTNAAAETALCLKRSSFEFGIHMLSSNNVAFARCRHHSACNLRDSLVDPLTRVTVDHGQQQKYNNRQVHTHRGIDRACRGPHYINLAVAHKPRFELPITDSSSNLLSVYCLLESGRRQSQSVAGE